MIEIRFGNAGVVVVSGRLDAAQAPRAQEFLDRVDDEGAQRLAPGIAHGRGQCRQPHGRIGIVRGDAQQRVQGGRRVHGVTRRVGCRS